MLPHLASMCLGLLVQYCHSSDLRCECRLITLNFNNPFESPQAEESLNRMVISCAFETTKSVEVAAETICERYQ
jgi:hypothetical protein